MSVSQYSRATHTVRVKSADERFYADVEVLDAISLTLPNNFQIAYKISKPNVNAPNITDNTGDGNGEPGKESSTRASHMMRVTSTANPAMFFDVEVCDAFTITGPNNADFCIACQTPNPKSVVAITDTTGSGLAVGATNGSTKAQHAVKLLRQVGSGTPGLANQQIATDYTLTLLTDAFVEQGPLQTLGMPWLIPTADFGGPGDPPGYTDWNSGPWYDMHVLQFYNYDTVLNGALSPGANTLDLTQYVTDPGTGQQVPPPNTDPNVYVYFPDNTGGPFLGATPYTASGLPGNQASMSIPAIDMGPIWWIRALGAVDNVWFWYLSPVQQPLDLSYFRPGGPEPVFAYLGGWGYSGFTALPYFSVTYIVEVNYSFIPLGTYGADNLATAALDQDGLSWMGVGTPDGGWGVANTAVTGVGDVGAFGLPSFIVTLDPYYTPYGAFDLTAPTAAELLKYATKFGLEKAYTNYGGPMPNVWELTGIQQPGLTNTTPPPGSPPGTPPPDWDPTTNPHQQPGLALAKQVCQKFADNWNAVANAIQNLFGNVNSETGLVGTLIPPPGWNWAKPYGGSTVATAQQFSNGWIVPAVMELCETVPTIAVGQLDPSVWDVSPVVNNGTQPVTWASETPPPPA